MGAGRAETMNLDHARVVNTYTYRNESEIEVLEPDAPWNRKYRVILPTGETEVFDNWEDAEEFREQNV